MFCCLSINSVFILLLMGMSVVSLFTLTNSAVVNFLVSSPETTGRASLGHTARSGIAVGHIHIQLY